MNDIGKNIEMHRKRLGLTQKELAQKSGVSEMSIRRYEHSERTPSIKNIKPIAAALGVSISDLDPDTFADIVHNAVTAAHNNSYPFDVYPVIPEGKQVQQIKFFSDSNYKPDTFEDNLLKHFHNLNEKGQLKAIDQVEMLSKIPEFKKD